MGSDQHDVRYAVFSQRGGEKIVYTSWSDACAACVRGSLADQTAYVIDVYVDTEPGARRFAGDEGIARFRSMRDHEQVFERIEIRADALGVP
jgi:hypothetical protein